MWTLTPVLEAQEMPADDKQVLDASAVRVTSRKEF